MSVKALRKFFAEQIEDAKANGVLLSLHLKATMMKVSDPVMFGHAVTVFFKDVFEKHAAALKQAGVNPNLGLGDLYKKIETLPADKRAEIEADIKAVYATRPALAMVDSDKGITNLHVPNDVIVDASMPVVVRESGPMWGPDGKLDDDQGHDPGSLLRHHLPGDHGGLPEERRVQPGHHGRASPTSASWRSRPRSTARTTRPSSPPARAPIRVVDDASGATLLEQKVEEGDIFRMCQAKDVAHPDWVKLAGQPRPRHRRAGHLLARPEPRPRRAGDRQGRAVPEGPRHQRGSTSRSSPRSRPCGSRSRGAARGKDTISVTGNVLRDYLTDLFPILEIGTRAKMLSIVPLLAGGGLFETGAGGSAPKHVQQFAEGGLPALGLAG